MPDLLLDDGVHYFEIATSPALSVAQDFAPREIISHDCLCEARVSGLWQSLRQNDMGD